jgi:hypothetical protein
LTMKRWAGWGFVSAAAAVAAFTLGIQLAPAAERLGIGDDSDGRSALEFVGRAEQTGASIAIFGYVTHIANLDDAALFVPSASSRNESTARLSFSATTTISQNFTVLPLPTVPSLFDVDSAGSLSFWFTEAPAGRSFAEPASFASGTEVARHTLHLQDVVAALVGVDPSRGVVDGNGELCQQSVTPFRLAGEMQRLGRPGLVQSVFTHGWTVRTNPNPPQSFTHVGGHTTPLGKAHC